MVLSDSCRQNLLKKEKKKKELGINLDLIQETLKKITNLEIQSKLERNERRKLKIPLMKLKAKNNFKVN